jgi:hypothetical protein
MKLVGRREVKVLKGRTAFEGEDRRIEVDYLFIYLFICSTGA